MPEQKQRNRMICTYGLIGIHIVIFAAAELFGGSTKDVDVLIRWGGAHTGRIAEGQYWRLFTSMFLHSGIRHLLNNMLMFYGLGNFLEPALGHVKYVLTAVLGGLTGSVVNYLYYLRLGGDVVSVGASGMVFAILGALLWVVIRSRGKLQSLTVPKMILLTALALYFGFATAGTANAAHLGGLAAGFVLSILLYRKPRSPAAETGEPEGVE